MSALAEGCTGEAAADTPRANRSDHGRQKRHDGLVAVYSCLAEKQQECCSSHLGGQCGPGEGGPVPEDRREGTRSPCVAAVPSSATAPASIWGEAAICENGRETMRRHEDGGSGGFAVSKGGASSLA